MLKISRGVPKPPCFLGFLETTQSLMIALIKAYHMLHAGVQYIFEQLLKGE